MDAVRTRADLVGAAADLVPLLRANALRASRAGRVPEEVLAVLREAGLLRMLRPARFGGHEVDMVTKSAVLAELAKGCGATSWVAVIHNDADFLVGRLPDHLQELVFAEPGARTTATLNPMGTAEHRRGGYVVTARWPFNTGSLGADWAVQPTVCDGEPVWALIPYSDLVVEDDWEVTGMRASASNTVRAEEVFVPEDRVVRQWDVLGVTHLSERNAGNRLYGIPLLMQLITGGPAPFTGMAATALRLVREQLGDKPISYTAYESRRVAPITHHQIAEAALLVESADRAALAASELIDRLSVDGVYGPEDKPRVWGLVSFATRQYTQAADILRAMAGAAGLRAGTMLSLVLRDLQALSAHAAMMPATGIEHYGRALCGLEPTFPPLFA